LTKRRQVDVLTNNLTYPGGCGSSGFDATKVAILAVCLVVAAALLAIGAIALWRRKHKDSAKLSFKETDGINELGRM
jgi:hypothetical protein